MTFTLSSADLIEVSQYLIASFSVGYLSGSLHRFYKVLVEKL